MALDRYRDKRDFARTPEPEPGDVGTRPREGPLRFVVHLHDATRRHFDLRLELDGALQSWAVPKGPSLDPKDKRLAVRTEPHPIEYLDFEGLIPPGEYGAGPMILWDEGTWHPRGDPRETLEGGHLKLRLEGRRLRGGWTLVRTRGDRESQDSWLLRKEADATAATPGDALVESRQTSVRTRRTLADVAAEREAAVPDAPAGPLPTALAPALCTLVDAPPSGPEWLHEIKLDGYRALVRLDERRARVFTRAGHDWTDRFPDIAAAVAALPARAALLDGEIVALDEEGRSSFSGLVAALEAKRPTGLVYFAFDLLHLDGRDLRGLGLQARKAALGELVRDPPPSVRLLAHVLGGGPAFHRAACHLALEGTVSKRADAPYRPGRRPAWTKARCAPRQELVIVGWTEPAGTRTALGALLVGYREGDAWRYAGRVGTGFDEATLRALRARLAPLERATPAVTNPPMGSAARGCHWVEPRLVCEVRYTEWTPCGRLRHPVFLGLREDKDPLEVTRDPAPTRSAVHLTSPDRVLWPDVGVTKRELADWLEAVADRMLPELRRRPLSLVRCPDGQDAGCFYQRHHTPGLPAGARAVAVRGHGEGRAYLYVEDRAGLVELAQTSALELHPWGVRVDDLDHPDRLIFDLDPGADVGWEAIVDAAFVVRDRLAALGLRSFAKLTGGKGVHVVVPLRPHADWDAARPFCRALAESLAARDPTRLTAKMARDRREGRVYVDYLRNTPTSTAVAAWSPRARPGAPLAVPVAWEELRACGGGDRFHLRDCLSAVPVDPWPALDDVDQRLDAGVIRRMAGA